MPVTQEAVLHFGKGKLTLKFNIIGAATLRFMDVEKKDDKTAQLKFSTPKFASQPICKLEARWLENFKGMESLEKDVVKEGYSMKALLGAGNPSEKKFGKGRLLYWMTPTFGSSVFYYLSDLGDPAKTVRIGPVPGTIDKDISIDWENTSWSN